MERGVRHGRAGSVVLAGIVAALGVTAALSMRVGAREDEPATSGTDLVAGTAAVAADTTTWSADVTTPFGDGGRRQAWSVGAEHPVDLTIDVTADGTRRWRGTGAALTDASVRLLDTAALDLLFDPTVRGGAGLDVVRLPLSATDFSTRPWTWEPGVDGAARPSAEALAAVDVIRAIRERRADLSVVGAAWMAPASMRTGSTGAGGRLADVDGYGELLLDQVDWLRSHDVPVTAVSLGNEPGHLADSPTLAMTDDQMIELSHRLSPVLDDEGVELLALDHNWSDAGRARDLVTAGSFDAVGFHCYDGDPSAMSEVMVVPLLVTECTATSGGWHESVGWAARELVGEGIRAGSTGLVMWNLALDPEHGPKAPGGCADCRGLLTIDPSAGTVSTTPEFDVLAHLGAAADPGARILRVDEVEGLPLAAFANPDGSVGIFGHNDRPEPVSVAFRLDDGRSVSVDVPSWALFSLRG